MYAKQVGEEIAKNGGVVVCGGLAGVMEAVCKGAKNEGGTTIGILPGVTKFDVNAYVDIPIITGMGIARNIVIVRTADVLIALEGSAGTLSEIALALNIGKPVVAVNLWQILKHENLPEDLLHFVSTPEEAVTEAVKLVKK
ncbi:MAG: TIGR00725 family protein [Thermoplasmata archaeon]|nr:MAG: TIGR00725 family protein [Thermoplasmata archaeon]